MKKLDVIIIISILILSFIGYITFDYFLKEDSDRKIVEIYVKGELYQSYRITKDLDKEINIDTDLGSNTIHLNSKGANITDANCPDKVCVEDGLISESGEMLVCLPHKVVIEIKSDKKSEVDDSTY
mgnify:CR=1 FL=1